ncbi:MAG: hypothetical protein KatS3mg111_3186 [Pirellulaceae bacterium]|nr:MAG: hypothetical protein KatS3mg111_3186 [Pirellulaceae bacterium]
MKHCPPASNLVIPSAIMGLRVENDSNWPVPYRGKDEQRGGGSGNDPEQLH